jgi:hypothetical protein
MVYIGNKSAFLLEKICTCLGSLEDIKQIRLILNIMSKGLGAKTSIYLSTFESIFAADSKSKIKM